MAACDAPRSSAADRRSHRSPSSARRTPARTSRPCRACRSCPRARAAPVAAAGRSSSWTSSSPTCSRLRTATAEEATVSYPHLAHLVVNFRAVPLEDGVDLLDQEPLGLLPRQAGVRLRPGHAGVDAKQRIVEQPLQKVVLPARLHNGSC